MSDSTRESGQRGSSSERGGQRTAAVSWADPSAVDVCVVGAGAVGGLLGGQMARAGADVTLFDRGAHLDALAEQGLTLIARDGSRTVIDDLRTAETPSGAGTPDLVVLGVKTYDLSRVAPLVSELCGPDTVILPVQNGIPWWYFHRLGGELDGRRLRTVDPDGVLDDCLDTDRVLGCIPFVAATVPEPGAVRHTGGEWFPVGELDGRETPRVAGVADLLEVVGLRSRVLEDVRSELWLKEIGNLAFNPISALTRASLEEICREPGTRALARTMMEEAKPVAEDLGATFRRSIEQRIDGAEAVGDHQTSMLQDVKRGNRLETESLVGAVVELADITGHAVPTIETVYSLTTLLEATQYSP